MKNNLRLMTIFFLSWFKCSESQSNLFDSIRDVYLQVLDTSQTSGNLRLAEQLHKLQPKLGDDVPFPCKLKNVRSEERPVSVHTLKPGDIDVIGALGDSIFSGNGLTATNVLQIGVENRGMSFAIGGQGSWRQFLTLPNILKEFNPRLIGYSLQNSFSHHSASQFNAAIAAAISRDMPHQTKMLITKLETSPNVDIKKDWKMISILIGANDFCSRMCYNSDPESIIENHKKDLMETLRLLRDNLPRTIVNVIVTPNMRNFANTTRSNLPSVCYLTQNTFCSCLSGSQLQSSQQKFDQVISKWQEAQIEVANDPEFDREDFTVVAQPFTRIYKLHTTEEGLTDYSHLSADCFHMSQKEAARAALSLWNNIIEPVGNKSVTPSELFNLKCPKNQRPYIFTRRNS